MGLRYCNAWTCCDLGFGHFSLRDRLCACQFDTSASPSIRPISSPPRPLKSPSPHLKCHTDRQPSLADATGVRHFDSRQSNVTCDVHNNSLVSPLFGRHALSETHFTAYSTICSCTSLCSLVVLEHRLAYSVHVYNTLCLAQSRHRIIAFFSPSFCLRARRLKPYARYESQLSRWSNACPSRSAPSRSVSASRTHTHTHTHTLSLSLSLLLPFLPFPSGLRTLLGSRDYPSNSHVDQVPTLYYSSASYKCEPVRDSESQRHSGSAESDNLGPFTSSLPISNLDFSLFSNFL